MDHKKNYVQLYNGLVKVSDLFMEKDLYGFIQIGILLESLKCMIQKIDMPLKKENDLKEMYQDSDEQGQETQEEIDEAFGREAKFDHLILKAMAINQKHLEEYLKKHDGKVR